MIDVVIYRAKSHGYFEEDAENRVSDIESIDEARLILLELYDVYCNNPEWNIKTTWISEAYLEAHIVGFCKDEHYMLVLEDSGNTTAMEMHNEHIRAKMERLDH